MTDTTDDPLTPERLTEMRGVYERYWGGAARNMRKDFVLALIAEVERLRVVEQKWMGVYATQTAAIERMRADALTPAEAYAILDEDGIQSVASAWSSAVVKLARIAAAITNTTADNAHPTEGQ